MEFKAQDFIRPDLWLAKAYSSAREESKGKSIEVFLDANENCEDWTKAGANANRYPDPNLPKFREILANYYQVSPEELLITRGADEAIECLIRATCQLGLDEILFVEPGYTYYRTAAIMQGIATRSLSLTKDFRIPENLWQGEFQEKTRLLFLCRPNNPSGTVVDKMDIFRLLKAIPKRCLLVLDEAYIEFILEESFTQALRDFPNLVLLRTLSKAWGLAGLRVGGLLAESSLVREIRKVQSPYPIPSLIQNQVIETIETHGASGLSIQVKRLKSLREELKSSLEKTKIFSRIIPSEANFILAFSPFSAVIHSYLEDRGIRVRLRQVFGEEALRISVGNAADQKRLIEELKVFQS